MTDFVGGDSNHEIIERLKNELASCRAVCTDQAGQISALLADIVKLRSELGEHIAWRVDREAKDMEAESDRQSESAQ